MRRPPRKPTQKDAVDGIKLFAPTAAELRREEAALTVEAFEAKVLEQVMDGRTLGAAERIAARTLLRRNP